MATKPKLMIGTASFSFSETKEVPKMVNENKPDIKPNNWF